ncbi:MAG TPA: RNA polymerase sigma factor, partial [Candidatus Saccharimonadales bacterium]|nr:RNA polymerase sigma factor [Candidatus Saccharimonadales bacterium]
MKTLAANAWGDGLTSKKFQRIWPAHWSDGVKEGCMGDPDEALVLQSQNGDPAAFEALIRNHQHMIHSLTFRMTGSLADAEDLAQETFIRAYRQIGSYRGAAKFSTWLYRIAINLCLTWRRRESCRFEMHADWTQMNGAPSNRDGSDVAGRVQAALLKLPAKQ